MRRYALILVLATPFVLGACGLRGDLKTPPPIWGEDKRSDEEIKANAPSVDQDLAPQASLSLEPSLSPDALSSKE